MKSLVLLFTDIQKIESFSNLKLKISDITKYVPSIDVGWRLPEKC
jgi:hypothetical protein